jgi:hypothetical protein
MKLRHAVGLALVGWYLMIPTLVDAPYKIDTEAPLTSWKVYQTFDTAQECRKSQSSAQSKYEHTATAPSGSIKRGTRAFALQMVFARCIASDDSRLKHNRHSHFGNRTQASEDRTDAQRLLELEVRLDDSTCGRRSGRHSAQITQHTADKFSTAPSIGRRRFLGLWVSPGGWRLAEPSARSTGG